MIHITETARRNNGEYVWGCRCGDYGLGFTDRAFARKSGDAHLAERNAPEAITTMSEQRA